MEKNRRSASCEVVGVWDLQARDNCEKILVQEPVCEESREGSYVQWAQTVQTWAQTLTKVCVGSDCYYSVGSDCSSDCTASDWYSLSPRCTVGF